MFLDEMSHCRPQLRTFHHRTFDGGAVLGIVNALRFASTRPMAGPSGIDDASARLASGNYAMVVSVSTSRMRFSNEVDQGIVQAYVGIHHVSAAWHSLRSPPRPTERASAGAYRARYRAQVLNHRSPLSDSRERLSARS
jgi:hypothetical protein